MTTTHKETRMPDQPSHRAPVTLECQLTVGERTFTARQMVSRALWDDGHPEARTYAEDTLRRQLGEQITRELVPPIRVIEHDDSVWASLMTETES